MANSAFLQLANPIVTQKSYLTGWRFTTNPWQFNLRDGTPTLVASTTAYSCDQTIIQSEEPNNVEFSRDITVANTLKTNIVNAGTSGRLAIIQYIDRATAAGMVAIPEFSGRMFGFTNTSTVDVKMSLLYFSTDTPPLAAITSWGINPTFDGVFTEIKSANDPVGTLTTTPNSVQFPKYDLTAVPTNSHIAIVVYTTTDLIPNQAINWADVSIVRGPLGVASNPQTADDVLRACEFYYQHSYDNGVIPGTITTVGESHTSLHISFETSGPDSWALMAGVLSTVYTTPMRAAPIHNYYTSSSGLIDNVDWTWFEYDGAGAITPTGSGVSPVTTWEFGNASNKGIFYPRAAAGTSFGALTAPDPTTNNTRGGYLSNHHVADARLGVAP